MLDDINLKVIAVIRTDFPEKFGIPRQSGIIPSLKGKIVFEPEYRNREALRGLEEFSHLWLLWKFSESVCEDWSPTVRPPRLGGNKRVGVFATRSPFRPNPIGLSSVKNEGVITDSKYGTIICVSGVDLMDKTPIYDIKPYIPYTDSHPDATGGFSETVFGNKLQVQINEDIGKALPEGKLNDLKKILADDPRPAYQIDKDRVYNLKFSGYNIKFSVDKKILTVISIKNDHLNSL